MKNTRTFKEIIVKPTEQTKNDKTKDTNKKGRKKKTFVTKGENLAEFSPLSVTEGEKFQIRFEEKR